MIDSTKRIKKYARENLTDLIDEKADRTTHLLSLDEFIEMIQKLREEGYSKVYIDCNYSTTDIIVRKEWLETDKEYEERQERNCLNEAKFRERRKQQYEELKKEFG